MKVQRLFLRDVRSIKNLDLDFRDPVTGKPMSRIVLAGANGSGKTTILECIFGLLSSAEDYGAQQIPFDDPFENLGLKRFPHARFQILFEVGFPDEPSSMLSVSFGATNRMLDDLSISEYAEVGLVESGLDGSSIFRRLAAVAEAARQRETDAIGSVLYFPNDRNLPTIPRGELGFEPRTYAWAYRYQTGDEWKGSTESYLFSLNYLDLEDRDRKMPADRFGRTVDIVNSVLIDKAIARIEQGRVVVVTKDGDTHGLGDLSSGEKQLVLLLIEITRRIVPGSVILIDEPEISLHPTWQRGLVAALDKIIEQYDAQVIMATHSLEIATSVMPHEVISLSELDELPRGEWKPEVELAV